MPSELNSELEQRSFEMNEDSILEGLSVLWDNMATEYLTAREAYEDPSNSIQDKVGIIMSYLSTQVQQHMMNLESLHSVIVAMAKREREENDKDAE